MLNGANREKYGELKRGMAENYVTGTSEYPDSPEVVLCILNAYAREETMMKSSIRGKRYLYYLWELGELPAYIISGFGVL